MSVIIALVALSFLIFIHELGHFMAAKAVGIKVLEFALFMGPKLFSFTKGETTYSLRLIPMGGYCKMEGEDESSDDARSFSKQSVGKRALVIIAGPAMNILGAFVFAIIFLTSTGFYTRNITGFEEYSTLNKAGVEVGDRILSYDGKKIFDAGQDLNIFMYGEDGSDKEITYFDVSENKKETKIITPGKTPTLIRLGFTAKIVDQKGSNIIEMVEPDSPLDKAGIKRGDKVVKIDNTPITSRDDIALYLNVTRFDKLAPMNITIERNGKPLVFENVIPFADIRYDLGVNLEHRKGSVFEVAGASFNYCVSTMRSVIVSLGWLFNGTVSFKEMSGPVGIIGAVGSVVETQQSFSKILMSLLYFCSFISINLGMMNLIPFPALDGGMLFILLIEKLRGKPLPQEKVGMISMVGFVLLICVLIATLFNDIPRWLL